MVRDATLDAAFAPGKNVTLDGQTNTLTASGADWAIRGGSSTVNGVTTQGTVTLSNITVTYSANTGASAPIGGNGVIGAVASRIRELPLEPHKGDK